jgi:hypothetical protein
MGYRNRAARSRAALAAVSGPVNSVLPAITGTKTVGQTLTCSTGTWSHSPSFTYQWRRNGSADRRATASTRLLAAGDSGALMTCTVTMADLVITAANVAAGAGSRKNTGTAGATITAGQVVYQDAADGKYKLADANSGTAAARAPAGIALHGALAGQPLSILSRGA